MQTDLFDYELPTELIAQFPLPRGQSRLLVLHRANGQIEHRRFPDLLSYLHRGDTLVLNDTRVIARRLFAQRLPSTPESTPPHGVNTERMPAFVEVPQNERLAAEFEILLLRPQGETQWETLVRPGKKARIGMELSVFADGRLQSAELHAVGVEATQARVVGTTDEGGRILDFGNRRSRDLVGKWGQSPLPPYIHQSLPPEQEDRYQTVYAQHDGSAAAPTAGLHFTQELLEQLESLGVTLARVTLHVGVDTFRPIKVEDTTLHTMHGEWISVSAEAAQAINTTRGRVVAVGTTSVRALETAALAATPGQRVSPYIGETRLFITPGYAFKAVDALITNFHLPRSTLLMLISALAGREPVLKAYAAAVHERYRFYSFGDAMLIL